MSQPTLDAKEIFLAAPDSSSPEALRNYLDKACAGDMELRRRVEELLQADQQAGKFLGGSASYEATVNEPMGGSLPCKMIGPYKLLQQIGEGGMGTVYMAEQTEPIQRKVALKLVRPGQDNRQTAARFETERQALALMEHQNIATVLDAGTTETGQPYFVMELVHGIPITKFCDQHRLSPRERLQLFIPVCQAVQHAHQKGVIHRDIKPSNILVAMCDGRPVPKVIDFGVAKALGQKLTDKTMFTAFGSIVGTLEYMSPEQAEYSHLATDTRSDIYSLGVVLYELLTGTTPLDCKRFKNAAILELLRIIKDEEPPKPSTRLSTTDALPSIAANRSLEPRKLSGLLRGELDWIVMKAIDKDRNRRYETANGFAADIQRHLSDEPVSACPPSAAYRFRKFARRNKGLLLGVTAVACALIAGIITSTLLMFRAQSAELLAAQRLEAEIIASRETEKARKATEEALKAVELERDRAEVGFAQARETVNQYLTQVSENQLLTAPGLQPLRRELLQLAVDYYEDFLRQRGNDLTIQADIAATHLRLHRLYIELGLNEESKAAAVAAGKTYEVLLEAQPDNPEFQFGSGQALFAQVQYHDAIKVFKQLVEKYPDRDDFQFNLARTYHSLALVESKKNNTAEQLRLYQAALKIQEHLVKESPDHNDYRVALGKTLNNIGVLLRGADQLPARLEMYRNAVKQYEIVYVHAPHLLDPGASLAISHSNVARCLEASGDSDGAEASYRKSLEILRKLAIDNSAVPWIQVRYGLAAVSFSRWQREHGSEEEAQRGLLVIAQILSRLPRESANDQYNLACFHALYSAAIVSDEENPNPETVAESQQEADVAMQALQQAVANGYSDLQLLSTDKDLDSLRDRADFQAVVEQVRQAVTIAKLARTPAGQSASEELANQKRLLEFRREQVARDQRNPQALADLALNHHAIGVIQSDLAQWGPAAQSLAEARKLREELVQLEPDNRQRKYDLAATLGKQSAVAEQQGLAAEALENWNAQLRLLQTLNENQVDDADAIIALATAWYLRGETLWGSSRLPEALPCWEEGRRILQAGRDSVPEASNISSTLGGREFSVGHLLGNRGYFQLASEHLCETLAADQRKRSPGADARLALTAAWLGRHSLYREGCQLLLEKHGKDYPQYVAWAGGWLPDSGIPPEQLVQMAEEGLQRDTYNSPEWLRTNVCLAKYRAGDYEVPPNWPRKFLRAMIEYKRGGKDQARAWLLEDEGEYVALVDKTLAGMSDAAYPPLYGQKDWCEELATHMVRKEAWELIEGRVPVLPQQLLVDALLWSRVGDQVRSEQAIQAALNANPDDPDSLAPMIKAYEQIGTYEQCLAFFQKLIERNPERVEPWIHRGHYLLEHGDEALAEADFNKAATLTPNELNKFLEAGWWASVMSPAESNWFPLRGPNAQVNTDVQPALPVVSKLPSAPHGQQLQFPLVPELKGAATVYAMTYVYAPEKTAVTIRIGGTCPGELTLNGRKVCQWRTPTYDYSLDRVPILLQPGRNTLVAIISSPTSHHSFVMRIGDNRLDRGIELAHFGQWNEAIPLLKAEFAANGQYPDAGIWSSHAGMLAATEDWDAYRDFCQQMQKWMKIDSNPDSRLKGTAACTFAPIPASEADLLVNLVDQAVANNYSTGWPLNCQARVYLRAGRIQEALDHFTKQTGSKFASSRAVCQHHLGRADLAARELEYAEKQFLKYVAMRDGDPSTAWVCHFPRGFQDVVADYIAIREARSLIRPDTTPVDGALHTLQAAIRERLQSADQRLLPFEMSLICDGQNPQCWLAYGRARAEFGNWQLAQDDLAKAVALAPADPEVLAARARIFADLNHIDAAYSDVLTLMDQTSELAKAPNWAEVRRQLEADLPQWPALQERVVESRSKEAAR